MSLEDLDRAIEGKGGPAAVVKRMQPKLDRLLPAQRRFDLLSADDLRTMKPLEWALRNVLPRKGLACIYGPSGSGKSFLEVDLIAALAEGEDWFTYRVREPLRVVCVVLEGEHGFRSRIAAWEAVKGRPFPPSVSFVFQTFRLTDRDDVLALAAAVEANGGADVLTIDTLNRAAPGADENSSRDMGQIIENATELQSLFGGLVLLVAHTGKDPGKGLRGHSSLIAALDAAIEVSRSSDRREWRAEKVKDGRDGEGHGFRLEVVDLGEEDGEPITSCVVRTDDAPIQDRPRPPATGNQRIVFDALGPLLKASKVFGMAGAPPTRPCIRLSDAIEHTRDRLTVEPKRRTERAREAITGLIARRLVGCNEDWVWLT